MSGEVKGEIPVEPMEVLVEKPDVESTEENKESSKPEPKITEVKEEQDVAKVELDLEVDENLDDLDSDIRDQQQSSHGTGSLEQKTEVATCGAEADLSKDATGSNEEDTKDGKEKTEDKSAEKTDDKSKRLVLN